jgi:hypothetical protein
MPKLPNKGGPERHSKRSPRSRPDHIIEKRARWEDYLDPEEDPGLLEDEELLDPDAEETKEETKAETKDEAGEDQESTDEKSKD